MRLTAGRLDSGGGRQLRWRAWHAPQSKVALAVIHGLGEHSGRYQRLGSTMAGLGISTYAVDLRGMGESTGQRGHVDSWQDWVQDAALFVQMVQESVGGLEVIPLGHSFGGVVLISAVMQGDVQPRRFVLSNPALATRRRVSVLARVLGRVASRLWPRLALSNGVDPKHLSRLPEVVAQFRADHLVHDRISARLFTEWEGACRLAMAQASTLNTPYYLIIGGGDQLIDGLQAQEFEARTPARHQTRIYPDAYHEPFNDLGSELVFEQLGAWLVESGKETSGDGALGGGRR